MEYSRYDGVDVIGHIENNRYWYERDGQKLATHTLKAQDVKSLQAVLRQEGFWSLPSQMGNPRMDSYNCLKVWSAGKTHQVIARDVAGSESKADDQRFARILRVVQRVAPRP